MLEISDCNNVINLISGGGEVGFEISGTILKKYTGEPGVEKVVIPDGITRIDPMAMSFNCDHIKEIVIPEGVTCIGYECFWYSKALEKVTLPESLSEVMEDLFYRCPKLCTVNIPSALKKIGSGMFAECTSLKEIVVPEGVEEIGAGAFTGCKALKKVVLPDSLKTIEQGAFNGCIKLENINISDEVIIGAGAFEGCKSLDKESEYVIVQKELCGYNGDGNKVIIPDCVKTIGGSVFNKNKKIKEVYIPDSVDEIGSEAFKGCSNLRKIRISPKIGKIEAAMFWDCKALEEIEIPEGITLIEENAFRHCYALKTIRLPYSVKIIEKKAFSGTLESSSTDIHTVIIAPGTSIDEIVSPEDKFAAAIGYLKESELYTDESVVQSYRTYLSRRKSALLPLIWKNDMSYAIKVFADSGILTKKSYDTFLSEAHEHKAIGCVAYLMDWNNSIRMGTVKEEKKSKREKDPFSVSKMKKVWKFSHVDAETCRIDKYLGSDTVVTIPERIGVSKVSIIGSAFDIIRNREMVNLQEVVIPEGVVEIGFRAFSECGNLWHVSLPRTIKSIDAFVFSGCRSLTEIELPDGLERIGCRAFAGCRSLTTLKIPSSVTQIEEDAFALYSDEELFSKNDSPDNEDVYKINRGITIIASKGSVVAEYAEKNGLTWVAE